jgi:mono/diheme cytochrome c family protein
MKKLKLFLIRLVVCLALILFAAATAVFIASNRKLAHRYTVTVDPVAVPGTPEAIQRGLHVATIRGCTSCHGADLGGNVVMDNGAMGRVYGPNLTNGKGGIGGRLQNEDLVRAVREGVGSDGHPLFIMPSKDYVGLSDEDLGALLAYVGSVPAVNREVPSIKLGPVSRVLLALGKVRLSAEVIPHGHLQPAAHVAVEVSPAYGRYLASTCAGCHNPSFSGGKIAEGPPDWPHAANLTAGAGSAVAGWSEADFVRTIRTAMAPDGKAVNPVMPRAFAQMSDLELKAIWSFIQTLPPLATGHLAPAGI